MILQCLAYLQVGKTWNVRQRGSHAIFPLRPSCMPCCLWLYHCAPPSGHHSCMPPWLLFFHCATPSGHVVVHRLDWKSWACLHVMFESQSSCMSFTWIFCATMCFPYFFLHDPVLLNMLSGHGQAISCKELAFSIAEARRTKGCLEWMRARGKNSMHDETALKHMPNRSSI